ncbi:MAG: iron ABC transporter permease [Pseudoflavonifractor sp.]
MSEHFLPQYAKFQRRKGLILLVLCVLVLFLALLGINAGAASLNPVEVLRTLLGLGGRNAALIIFHIRLPRVAAAIVAGAGLSVAGCVMQNNLKNPMASPQTLGISNAAAFGANVAIIFLGAGSVTGSAAGAGVSIRAPYLVTGCAFVCAMAATLLILALSKHRGFSPETIVLAGVALGFLFNAGITLLQYFAQDTQLAAAVFWTFGDLGRVSWQEVGILTAVTAPALVYFTLRRWDYNALDSGEDSAKGLGVNTGRTRFWGMLLSCLITAAAVSFLGMIGFVGLLGPQMMRRLVGPDHRWLLPASALAGAAILLAADTLGRVVLSPIVLPVGAVTSLLGAPMLLYLLMRGYSRK